MKGNVVPAVAANGPKEATGLVSEALNKAYGGRRVV